MDRSRCLGNGCNVRAGWNEAGGSGHILHLVSSWLTKVLLQFLATGKSPLVGAHKDEINHWLRDAWRSHTWNKWLTKTKNHRAHAIGHREWSTIRTAFDELRAILKKLSPELCASCHGRIFLDLSVVRPFSMEPVTVWNPPVGFVVVRVSLTFITRLGAAHFGRRANHQRHRIWFNLTSAGR